MEHDDGAPREPWSVDSNVKHEESLRRNERSDQVKSIEPIQVSSLPPSDNELEEVVKDKHDSKSPKESIDIDFMNLQLREKHKEASENWSEKRTLSQGSACHPGAVSPDDNEMYANAKRFVPESLIDIKYPHQIKIAEILNVKRGDRQDFRLVAHHLGFHTSLILTASETLNPMMTIFEHCTRVKGQVLVEALFKCKRFDAMKVIVDNYSSERLKHSISQEERRTKFIDASAVTGSLEDDRFRASSDPARQVPPNGATTEHQTVLVASTPHEEPRFDEDDDDWVNAVPGGREFWDRIQPENGTGSKKLKHINKAFKKMFESDEYKTEFPFTWKLIVHTLDIDGSSDDVLIKPEKFRQMLAFLGPPTNSQNGCIRMAGELRKKSQRKSGKSKISWFAGRMDQTDAERKLEREKPGTFLIRYSTSHAELGWFVLAVKTEDVGVVQFQIEQKRSDEGLIFRISEDKREFSSLWELVEFYEVNQLVDENEEVCVYLEHPCPELPLNAICSGYRKGKGKK